MDRERIDGWCERGILALVLGILVFGPLAMGAVGTLEFLILQGLAVGVLLLWTIRLWVNERPKLLWPPLCWAVLAFAAYAIARYGTADIEYLARQELIRVLIYAFLFFAILNNLHRQESTTLIGFTLVFLAMAIAGYAVYQYATGSDRVWHLLKPYQGRGSGTYICPNHLGGFLELLLPLALAYTLTGRLKPVTRVLMGYAALVITAGIVVTLSRGAWLATGLSLVLLFGVLAMLRRYRLPAAAFLVLLTAGLIILVPRNFTFQHRARQLVAADTQVRDDLRFALWQPAWRMWQDHPWWGVGPAHFDARFGQYRPDKVQMRPDRVHNDYLNTLADWGLAGAGLVAAALGLLGWGVVRTWRGVRVSNAEIGPRRGSNKFAFVVGAAAGLAAILAHSVVDFNLHIPANAILTISLMALLSAHLRFASDHYWVSAGYGLKTLATLGLLTGAVWLTFQGWRRGAEYAWLRQAERAEKFSPDQVQLLKRALAVEPHNYDTTFEVAEALRRQSQEGGQFYEGLEGVTYADLAREALEWFDRGSRLNPWDARNFLGAGWCLDWLKRHEEARARFQRALELEPNSYLVMNYLGLHYIETGNYAAARACFERALRLEWRENDTARNYLAIINSRLLEAAEGGLGARLRNPSP